MQKAAIPLKAVPTGSTSTKPSEQFRGRESDELVIAFSGAIGCGIGTVIKSTERLLKESGYIVERVKLSDFIQDAIDKNIIKLAKAYPDGKAGRYERLQDGGNELRTKFNSGDILAEYAVRHIASVRTASIPESISLDQHIPEKRAYLIDQLKHPQEVNLLRVVYRNLFYLVGVLSVSEKRRRRLIGEDSLTPMEATAVMERDKKEPIALGQQLEKTLQLADFFLRNDKPNVDQLDVQLKRFMDLMHGVNGITPTRDEYGMYVAYAASLGSACLSRLVGAAILEPGGDVLATGKNDVPRFGGGLYSSESGEGDARCVKLEGRRCWNDHHKNQLLDEVREVLDSNLKDKGFNAEQINAITAQIQANSRIKDLIEFSRSIHAEMDALLSVARQGAGRLEGATLYCTTFPCHSCARHIVTAGLHSVYYIEPYEKSLAGELHSDSISLDPEEGPKKARDKVQFIHFEGVAPRQYINMFKPTGERKQGGVAINVVANEGRKVVPEYLDDYRAFESKVVAHLEDLVKP